MKGVILAGGTGSRLRPITHTGPKQLIPVANQPVLQYGVEDFRDAGITDIGVVLGHKGREEIQEFLGDGSGFGVDVTYIVQSRPLGLAHAAGCARQFVGDDDFVMYLGDNILNHGIAEIVESFRAGDYDAGIALQEVPNPQEFGIAEVDSNGEVLRLVEKPDDPPSNLALIGVYVFSHVIFDLIQELTPSWRGELEITDALQLLIDGGYNVDSHTVMGWWKDTGKPEDILHANRLVLEEQRGELSGTIEDESTITGPVALHESSTIKSGAVVRGPVSIGRETVIDTSTYLGPFTSIGEKCYIENAHIENSVVIGESQITTGGKIVDSLIGRGASIETADDLLPEGRRLIVGENSRIKL